MGFAPIGRVRELDVLRSSTPATAKARRQARGPVQGRIQREGNAYLRAEFPKLDFIKRASIADTKSAPGKD